MQINIDKIISYMETNLPTSHLNGLDIRGLICEAIDAYPLDDCRCRCGSSKCPELDYIRAIAHNAFADTIIRKSVSVESLGVFKLGKANLTNTIAAEQAEIQKLYNYHKNKGRSFYNRLCPPNETHSIQ